MMSADEQSKNDFGAPAVPGLIEAMSKETDPIAINEAIETLGKIGPAAVPGGFAGQFARFNSHNVDDSLADRQVIRKRAPVDHSDG
jgi:hypothetical protein